MFDFKYSKKIARIINDKFNELYSDNFLKIGLISFLLSACLWIIIYILIPPTFSGTDVVYFKDAGINFALGKGLVTRIGPGNSTIEPRFYANYPPIFPYLFGLFCKVFGIGPKVSRIFDLLLAAFSSIIFWFAVQSSYKNHQNIFPNYILLFLLIITLPLGPFWVGHERPDNLSFVLIITSFLIMESGFELIKIFSSTIILGFNAMVSPFGFTLNFMALIFLVVRNTSWKGRYFQIWRAILIAVLGTTLPIIIIIIILWFQDTSVIFRFLDHATGKTLSLVSRPGIGNFLALLSGDIGNYIGAFASYSNLQHKVKLFYLLFVTIMTTGYLVFFNKNSIYRQNLLLKIAIIIFAIYPLIFFNYQSNYMSFTATIILIIFTRFTIEESDSQINFKTQKAKQWIVVSCLFLLSIFETPYIIREIVVACQSGVSHYRMKKVLDNIFIYNKKSLLFATRASTYYLFKAKSFDVVSIEFLKDKDIRNSVDYFAISFVGTGNPFKPMYPAYWDADEYELLYRPELPQQTNIFGYPVSNSSNTWEVELYKKK